MEKLACALLVDDDPTISFIRRMQPEDPAVTEKVLAALNGREAPDVIRQQCGMDCCPELILRGISMPLMNGFEFLAAYEKLAFPCKQSVVILMLATSVNPL
jgi:CheY-like chemotaxis protein